MQSLTKQLGSLSSTIREAFSSHPQPMTQPPSVRDLVAPRPQVHYVLIHGLGATKLSWRSVDQSLNFDSRSYLTYDMNENFDDVVKRGMAHTLSGPTVVVGHSLGGVIGWHVAQNCENVIRGVSIAAPWGGFALPYYMFVPVNMMAELKTNSPAVRMPRTEKSRVPWTNVVATRGLPFVGGASNDGVISVDSQKRLEQSAVTVQLNYSHNEILHCDEILSIIAGD